MFVLFYYILGYQLREIIVSISSKSKDSHTCGNSTQPCHTLNYAIENFNKNHGDIVNIEAGFTYIVKQTIILNYSITLRKWNQDGRQLPNPMMSHANIPFGKINIVCNNNINVISVDFSSKRWEWLHLKNNCRAASIKNCLFFKSESPHIIYEPINVLNSSSLDFNIQSSTASLMFKARTGYTCLSLFKNSYVNLKIFNHSNTLTLYYSKIVSGNELILLKHDYCNILHSKIRMARFGPLHKGSTIESKLHRAFLIQQTITQYVVISNCKFMNTQVELNTVKGAYIYNSTFRNLMFNFIGESALSVTGEDITIQQCNFCQKSPGKVITFQAYSNYNLKLKNIKIIGTLILLHEDARLEIPRDVNVDIKNTHVICKPNLNVHYLLGWIDYMATCQPA